MQYFLIALGTLVLFLAVLLLLTGGTMQNLVGFFVEELDDNNTPVHPVKLLQDASVRLFQRSPADRTAAAEVTAAPEAEEDMPELPEEPAAPEEEPAPEKPAPSAESRRQFRSNKSGARHSAPRSSRQGTKRSPNQVYTEIAILTHKIDERRRVVDSSGHSTLYDEYFELVFETRRGETLRLVATRATFKEIPFNQEGALTYKRNRILKFKYNGGTVVDEIISSTER